MKQIQILANWWLRKAAPDDWMDGLPAHALWEEPATMEKGWLFAGESKSVQEAFLDAGQLSRDVLDGHTDEGRWIGESDWIYCCDFPAELNGDSCRLVFGGLDTVVDVFLNGERFAFHDDMFLPLQKDCTGLLRDNNRLLLYFHAPKNAIRAARESFPEDWRDLIEDYCVLRKSPLDFLDFGKVTFLKIGLFEAVRLEKPDQAELCDTDVQVTLGEWNHWAEVTVDARCRGKLTHGLLRLELTGPDGKTCATAEQPVLDAHKDWTVTAHIHIDHPALWWPRNYGEQPLYRLTIRLIGGEQLLDEAEKSIGIRRLERTGDMRFRCNGREIKLWGANFAPFRGFTHNWERQKECCRMQMELAAQANMNCIRLWGGGHPYGEELYEQADRLGILIWQEFFLWWGYYPETEHYRALYRAEAEYHVRRLKHHPCILLWCAGNEILMCNEESHRLEDKRELSYHIFREDYAEVCHRLDPERLYLPTAPSGGDYPNDPRQGDTHPLYYTYRHAITDHPVFTSEAAHSSIGPLRSLRRFMTDEEIWPAGYVNQLTYDAYNPFAESYRNPKDPFFLTEWKRVPIPKSWWKHSVNYFASECACLEHFFDAHDAESLVYRINAAFAEYTRNWAEKARRGKPFYDLSGPRQTQGYLLWKINDTWPQFYCSLIDYYLETHIPYYQVKRSYAPILLSFDFQDHVYLWGVNDTAADAEGRLRLSRFSPSRNAVQKEIEIPVSLRAGESKVLTDLDSICPLITEEVLYAGLFAADGRELARSVAPVDIERNQTFQEAQITLRVKGNALLVQTDRYAHCVELTGNDAGDEFGWYFEDNYFDLLPFETKEIKIYSMHTSGTVGAKAHYSSQLTELSIPDGLIQKF